MSERELLEKMRGALLELAKGDTITAFMADRMMDKLTELMGEEAFGEWAEPLLEEAERVAQAEVDRMEAESEAMKAMFEGVQLS